jgi:hypothetical protein
MPPFFSTDAVGDVRLNHLAYGLVFPVINDRRDVVSRYKTSFSPDS